MWIGWWKTGERPFHRLNIYVENSENHKILRRKQSNTTRYGMQDQDPQDRRQGRQEPSFGPESGGKETYFSQNQPFPFQFRVLWATPQEGHQFLSTPVFSCGGMLLVKFIFVF